jgi:hypothetical protein
MARVTHGPSAVTVDICCILTATISPGRADGDEELDAPVLRPLHVVRAVKRVDQQGLSMLYSARSQLIGQRTQLINAGDDGCLQGSKDVRRNGLGGPGLRATIVTGA